MDRDDIRSVSTKMIVRRAISFLANGLNLWASSASAALERSREIDEQLRIENEERKATANVLIAGTSQYGKSVLLNSMKIVFHHNNACGHNFRHPFKEVIFTNAVQGMRTILDAMRFSELTLENRENEQHVETIVMQPIRTNSDSLDPDIALAIRALWSDKGVREYFEKFEMCEMIRSCS